VFAGLVCVFSFLFVGWAVGKEDKDFSQPLWCLNLLLGVILLVVFGWWYGQIFKDGSPVSDISPGVYRVGFVYQAGDYVSVGVEKALDKSEKRESLFLYQFPKKDFEGEVKTGAKKLVAYKLTTGDGTFNKYKLE
jgi:hypothetical protein